MYKKLLIVILAFSAQIFADPTVTVIAPFTTNDPIANFLHMWIVNQYFENAELILITTACSQKELLEIKEYQTITKSIYVLTSKNESISMLFNQAIAAAHGEFISYMRPEDYRNPQTFAAQIKMLETHPEIDVVYSDYHTSYNANTPTDNADNWYLNELPEFKAQWLYRDIPGPHVMWRKSLHTKYGSFKEDFEFHYQKEFWNRCAQKGCLFKKVHGKPGTFHFNYFNQKKILFDKTDFEKSYQEEKYIRDQYGAMWSCIDYQEKPFVIVTASYKNKDWYKRNLDSVFSQNYNNYEIIYIDDCCPDQTGKLVQEYAHECNKQKKITVIINNENRGALANIYNAIHMCSPEKIIIILDGDDWLAHDDVLKYLNNVYQDPNIWLTYGQFEWFPYGLPGFAFQVPYWVIERNTIRDYAWATTHLRSFYAGLFQKIKKEDLFYDGRFFAKAWDLGMMYPMIEMAAYHIHFIPEILYVYNTANQINDNKVDLNLQAKIDVFIRKQEKYAPITSWAD